jgi:hypothetical protein
LQAAGHNISAATIIQLKVSSLINTIMDFLLENKWFNFCGGGWWMMDQTDREYCSKVHNDSLIIHQPAPQFSHARITLKLKQNVHKNNNNFEIIKISSSISAWIKFFFLLLMQIVYVWLINFYAINLELYVLCRWIIKKTFNVILLIFFFVIFWGVSIGRARRTWTTW